MVYFGEYFLGVCTVSLLLHEQILVISHVHHHSTEKNVRFFLDLHLKWFLEESQLGQEKFIHFLSRKKTEYYVVILQKHDASIQVKKYLLLDTQVQASSSKIHLQDLFEYTMNRTTPECFYKKISSIPWNIWNISFLPHGPHIFQERSDIMRESSDDILARACRGHNTMLGICKKGQILLLCEHDT